MPSTGNRPRGPLHPMPLGNPMKRHFFVVMFVLPLLGVSASSALAQESEDSTQAAENASEKDWYYGPPGKPEATKTLGRQKAEIRARQRLTRMESMRWYGFSGSRPTASGIPFTTMYSPTWTRPGNHPFAWYTSQRPIVVVSPYYPTYYRPRYYR